MAGRATHWLDEIADQVVDEMKEDEDWIVGEFLEGQRAPGTVAKTEKEKLDFYKRFLLNPDGTWNEANQQKLLNMLDQEDYISIIQALNSNDAKGLVGVDRRGRSIPNRYSLYGEE